jgi:membrane associated rhomboid family serine protease
LTGKYTNIIIDEIINKLAKIINSFRIKEYHLLVNRSKFNLFSMIINIVVNLWMIYVFVISDSFLILSLINSIEHWSEIVCKYQYWKISTKNLLKRKYLDLFQQQILLFGPRKYSVVFIKFINTHHFLLVSISSKSR